MVGVKFCLVCKRGSLKVWESVCNYCWKKLEEHDKCWMCKGVGTIAEKRFNGEVSEVLPCPKCSGTGFVGKWREQMITLNAFREELRACGIDLFDSPW